MIGFHRKVTLYDSHVVKTARNRVSRYCNKIEAELSGSSPYLARVLSVSEDFSTLKMERVVIPGLMERIRISHALKKKLGRFSDLHWYNVGLKDGTPVLYDYGGTFVIFRIITGRKPALRCAQ